MFGVQETHSQQHEVGFDLKFAVGDFGHCGASGVFGGAPPLDADGVEAFYLSVAAGEGFGEDAVIADSALLVGGGGAEDDGPLGPGVAGGAVGGRLGQEFVLADQFGALSVGGAEAVGAGIAAAEDDDALALGGQAAFGIYGLAGVDPVLLGKVFHREMDAVEFAAGDGQVAGLGGAAGEA